MRIRYTSLEGDPIPAFFLLPDGGGPFVAILVHHQHRGERHLGKSEVCGLAGDPLQAFGPAFARRVVAVLAPDSICFEDRRRHRTGTEPDEENDPMQHLNEMCYHLLRGDTLMRKVLSDSAVGISLLRGHRQIDSQRIGMLGHFFRYKMARETGIEMAEVIPGFVNRYDVVDRSPALRRAVSCWSLRQRLCFHRMRMRLF